MSTHYTHYDLTYFIINCLAVLAVVIPKLPSVSPPLLLSSDVLLLRIRESVHAIALSYATYAWPRVTLLILCIEPSYESESFYGPRRRVGVVFSME